MSVPLVVLGTSLGGLDALHVLLGGLSESLPAAVAVVQHRRADNETRLATLLSRSCRLTLREAQDKDAIEAETVYLAPADYHLLVDNDAFALSVDAPVRWARPSIDVLMESAADRGDKRVIAVLLTAASDDGARGLEAVARSGGVTMVQDPAEAYSPIGPRAALARTRVDEVLPLVEIAPRIEHHVAKMARIRTPDATRVQQRD